MPIWVVKVLALVSEESGVPEPTVFPNTSVPLPVALSADAPATVPLRVSLVPLTLTVELAPPRVTPPARLLVPVEVASVPVFCTVTASVVLYATFCKSSVAPPATVVPAAFVPSASFAVTASEPALTVVAPV